MTRARVGGWLAGRMHPAGRVRGHAARVRRPGRLAGAPGAVDPAARGPARDHHGRHVGRRGGAGRPGAAHPPAHAGGDRGHRTPEQRQYPACLGQCAGGGRGLRLRSGATGSPPSTATSRRPASRRWPARAARRCEQSVLTPSVTLSYLVFDFGGRGGRIEGARQQLLAAGFTHNASIQDVVLQIQVAYFQYLANRSLLAGAADHPGRGPGEPRGGRGAAAGRAGHHRRRAPGANGREPGAARPAGHRGQSADHPRRRWRWRSASPRTCPTTWTPPRPPCRSARWPTAWTR